MADSRKIIGDPNQNFGDLVGGISNAVISTITGINAGAFWRGKERKKGRSERG